MAITQNDLEILKSEVMADTPDGGGLPTGVAVIDGVSNNLFPDVSDIDRLIGRVRLRKISLAVKTANADLLQAVRMLFTELPENPNISVFAFKASSFADRRVDAKNKIESYLAFGSKWAGHVLETQLTGQRVIQISLDKGDQIPAVGQPLVLVQNEGQSDEFYQYLRPLKVDTVERSFQRNVENSVKRMVVTIEFGDTLTKTFNGLTVPEFYVGASTSRRAILREARVADAAKYYGASRLAEPVVAMTTRQVVIDSIYTQVVPSTQVETPLLQLDAANQITTQARGNGVIAINQSVTVAVNTAFNLASGVAVGTLSMTIGGLSLTDVNNELVNTASVAYASINYGTGQVTWYSNAPMGQQTITGSYNPASEVVSVAQTDYQIVGDNAGYNFVKELAAAPTPNSLKVSYTVGGNNYTAHDNGRGLLVDDGGQGRGTIQGRTVLLSTAAIPDAGSYITYSFGADLGNTQYSALTLPKAYHKLSLGAAMPKGDITITWDTGSAVLSGNAITGDATGYLMGSVIVIAPNMTVAVGTDFTVSYNKIGAGGTKSVVKSDPSAITRMNDGSNNSRYDGVISAGEAITGGSIEVNMGVGALVVTLGISSNGLYLAGQSASVWTATLMAHSVDLATGNITFTIYAKAEYNGVKYSNGYYEFYRIGYSFYDTDVFMTLTASTASTTEADSKVIKAGSLFIKMPSTVADPIINGSVLMQAFGARLTDSFGQIRRNAASVGTIDYLSGLVALTAWDTNKLNSIQLESMLRGSNNVPVRNMVFKTPVAPLKENSLSVSVELLNGTALTLSTDPQGKITGSQYAHGFVDYKLGVVVIEFYEKLKVSDYPDIASEPWYDADAIYIADGINYINKPVYIKPNTVRYNAIAYSYLPLDKDLIGLDPVRLPSDGRVPFVRKGDSIAITELQTMQLPTNVANDTFDLGYERLSDVAVVDSTGLKVNPDYLSVDLDAGTLTLNSLFQIAEYTAPFTAKYRIMDIALVVETDISGRVTLSQVLTHNYSTAAVFSSMLLAGDMQARAFNVFSQKSWTGVFSNTLIGDAATSQLQVTNNPIVVTNRDAIEERWALVFTSQTAFRIIGQTVGEIGTGSTNTVTAPINPMTGYAYFTIPSAAWGTGWAANNVVRINTGAAKYPIWIGNAIQQHQGSSLDNYDFTIGYHANIDRDRV